jgi:hypothetical protein
MAERTPPTKADVLALPAHSLHLPDISLRKSARMLPVAAIGPPLAALAFPLPVLALALAAPVLPLHERWNRRFGTGSPVAARDYG